LTKYFIMYIFYLVKYLVDKVYFIKIRLKSMKNDIKKSLAREIAQTFINFKRFGIQKDHGLGMRQSEFMMLHTIAYSNPDIARGVKITELGNQLQITPAAVSHIIEALVEKKFVERFSDPADRRLVLIKLTEKGTEIINSMKIRFVKKCEELIGFIGEKDSQDLVRILTKTFNFFANKKI
jgi:DNA-binding MarR family transcriptional regulator